MESLEAFERSRDLPPETLGPPVNPFKSEIIPLRVEPSIPHVWQKFNRSAVFFLDENIVLKAQKQYHVPSVSLPGDSMLLEFGLSNFAGTQLERQAFTMLRSSPHPNLVHCLDVPGAEDANHLEGILFFERLDPLSSALTKSNATCRCRWAIQLASAFSHLELLGLIPTKAFIRDLGLDKTGRLKLTGFGASPRHPCLKTQEQGEPATPYHHEPIPSAEVVRQNIGSAHQRLASCLHYILTGIDPDEQAQEMGSTRHSRADRIDWREKVRRGEYPIAPGAEPIADVLQDAWTLRTIVRDEAVSFAAVEQRIRDAFEPLGIEDDEALRPANNHDYGIIEERCRMWLGVQEREPRWMRLKEYEEAVREATADHDA